MVITSNLTDAVEFRFSISTYYQDLKRPLTEGQ